MFILALCDVGPEHKRSKAMILTALNKSAIDPLLPRMPKLIKARVEEWAARPEGVNIATEVNGAWPIGRQIVLVLAYPYGSNRVSLSRRNQLVLGTNSYRTVLILGDPHRMISDIVNLGAKKT